MVTQAHRLHGSRGIADAMTLWPSFFGLLFSVYRTPVRGSKVGTFWVSVRKICARRGKLRWLREKKVPRPKITPHLRFGQLCVGSVLRAFRREVACFRKFGVHLQKWTRQSTQRTT